MTARVITTWVLWSAAATLLVLHVASNAGAQSGTSLAIDVGSASGCDEIGEGDEIEVLLRIENVIELGAWEATIVYDRDILEIVSQDNRQFIVEAPGSNVVDASEPLPDYNGRHLLSIGDASASAESGDGVLSIVVFRAVDEGTTLISIPQYDINGDGRTDEGAQISRYGGGFIGDVNGDGFFDGPVSGGIVAVDADCNDAETPEPTDPPTSGPGQSDSGDGGANTSSPSGAGPGVSQPPESGPPPSDGQTPRTPTPIDGTPQTPSDGDPNRSPESDDRTNDGNGDGDSFPLWLIAVLLTGGLAGGAAVVVYAVSRRP